MSWYLKSEKRIFIYSGIILFFVSIFVRFLALNQTPFANGWDGYYYVMQAHSFIEFGHLQSLDYSIIYPYYILFSYLFPNYIVAFKISTAVLSGILTFSCFKIIYNYFGKAIYLAIIGAALTIFSPGISFFVSQFPKNLLGIIFLLWVLYYLHKKKYFAAVIFIILSATCHRMTGGLGLIFLFASFISSMPWKYLITAIVLIVVASFLPGMLHFSDLARFNGQLSLSPQFAPLSFIKLGISQGDILWNLELVISSALCIGYFLFILFNIIRKKQITSDEIFILIFIGIIFFPFFYFNAGSMGYRFFLILFIIYPFLLVGILKNTKPIILLSASALLLMGSFFSYKSYKPSIHDAPNELYYLIVADLKENYTPEQYPLVIVHKSLAEVIIFKSDFDALNWAVPDGYDKNKVLRIVEGIPYRFLAKYINEDKKKDIIRLNSLYYALPEKLWESILEKANKTEDAYFLKLVNNGQNPLVKRPDFLLKGKN